MLMLLGGRAMLHASALSSKVQDQRVNDLRPWVWGCADGAAGRPRAGEAV